MNRRTPPVKRSLFASLVVLLLAGCMSVNPTPAPVATPTSPPASVAPSSLPTSAPSTATASPQPSPSAGQTQHGSAPPPTSGPTIDPQLAAQIDAVVVQVPPIRQLEPTRDVPYEFVTREQFTEDLLSLAFEDTTPEERAAEERAYKRLGLLPADADLTQMLVDLYSAEVAAYYDPSTGSFYVIQRDKPFGAVDKIYVAHEYTHALQDQHFDLEGLRIKDQTEGDAILAQLSVIEGDATLTSQEWALANLTLNERLQLLGEAASELDQNQLEGMPLLLRRQLEFPYTEGFLFTNDIYGQGGFDAVNNAITTPPASTEQILHSQKYFDQEAPVQVTLDDLSTSLGDGWSRNYEQTLGELNIQVLATGGESPAVNIPGFPTEWPHQEVAAGWGGDRLAMYEGPGDAWLIDWQTAWDTAADGQEFATRIGELQSTFGGQTRIINNAQGVRVVIASDPSLLLALPSG